MNLLYRIYIIPLLLLSVVAYPQSGNPAQKDTLLWFVGKWQSKTLFRADSNYLTGGAASSTIKIGADGSPSIQSGDGDAFNRQIDDGLSAVDNIEQKLRQEVQGTEGLGQYHLLAFSESAMDSVKAFFQRLKIQQSTSSDPNTNFNAKLAQDCLDQKADYDAIMQFWDAHKHIKKEHYDYPAPPQADYFNCWGCHRDLQIQFLKDCNAYTTDFFHPEVDLITKALAMMRKLLLIGRGGDIIDNSAWDPVEQQLMDSLFHHNRKDPSKSGPCAYIETDKLTQATAFLASRLGAKADQLYKEVKDQRNYNSFLPMMMVNMSAQDQMLQLGFGNQDQENQTISNCGWLAGKLLDSLETLLFKNYDYSYIASTPLMYEMLSEIQMLTGKERPDPYLFNLNNNLQFKLSLDMDIKINFKDHGYQYAHLKGEAKVAVELDSVICYHFILSKEEKQKITMNVLYNGMVLPKCAPNYTGTHIYDITLPELNIHFCKEGAADTLTLARMTPDPVEAGTWQYPCGEMPPTNAGINGLDGFFIDPEKVAQQAQAIKANAGPDQQQLEALKAQAEAMKQQLLNGGMGGINSPNMAANIKKMMDAGNTVMKSPISQIGRLVFPVTVQNKSKTLIDQRIDAKAVNSNPSLKELIVYGYLTIQLKKISPSD